MPTRLTTQLVGVVSRQRSLAEVVGAQGEYPVEELLAAGSGPRGEHDVLPVLEPDLEDQDRHEVPEVDEAEHGHGRGGVRGHEHLERPLGVAEVELQGKGRHEQEGERGQEGEPVGGLDRLDPEDLLERGQDEGPGHEAGEERIEHDQDAPLELDLVGVHEAFDALKQAFHGDSYRTDPSRPL